MHQKVRSHTTVAPTQKTQYATEQQQQHEYTCTRGCKSTLQYGKQFYVKISPYYSRGTMLCSFSNSPAARSRSTGSPGISSI
jgi:hypothetical protein